MPIKKGSVVGKLVVKENGSELFIVDLVTSKEIKKANIIELYIRYICEFINGEYMKIVQ